MCPEKHLMPKLEFQMAADVHWLFGSLHKTEETNLTSTTANEESQTPTTTEHSMQQGRSDIVLFSLKTLKISLKKQKQQKTPQKCITINIHNFQLLRNTSLFK